MPTSFYFLLCSHWASENLLEVDNNIAEGIDICQCSVHLCQQSSSTLEQEHVFLHGKSCSPSSTATGTQCTVVPHYWPNNVLTAFLPKERTGDNVTVRSQDCSVDATALSIITL
jgi:hypothetical protein